MPPKEKMPAGEIELLRQWDRGRRRVVDQDRPRAEAGEEDHGRRPRLVVVPAREGSRGADRRGTLPERDRLLRQRALKAEGLVPAPEADRRTLLRRLTVRSPRPAADAG
jgi:hypothetical protein